LASLYLLFYVHTGWVKKVGPQAYDRERKLSLIACSLTLMFSQSSVETYARYGEISNNRFTANLPETLQVNNNCKSVKI